MAGAGTTKDNADMLALSRVILTLTSANKSIRPPYRESKLTSLVQQAFGGNCCTVR